ncbi:outer membrane beta-barrel protein [Sphingobacterium sp. PU5-4]|uniref:Outer membrane beta-barrel protein n=1 Tax=Sphingobacterium tenebrionis TaxID=3111775 RepID=A0ABU8I4A6_9SPHI
MRHLLKLFLVSCISFLAFQANAQEFGELNGTVIDSARNAVEGAKVFLISGKDTLKTSSNKKGEFSFKKVKIGTAELQVSNISSEMEVRSVEISDKPTTVRIVLKIKTIQLEELVINKKPNPITIKKDTVEYNAAAFDVLEGDDLADLIKQLPGLVVDENNKVESNGKPVMKLRVNGEDFFTNNLDDFIKKLPAEIVSKIQIIEDYGDEANFTGVKTGEPGKLINIETKPGMNKGKFGNANAETASNDKAEIGGDFSFWKEKQQNGARFNVMTENNGAGINQSFNLSVNHRNKFKEKGNYNFGYNGRGNLSAFTNESFVETVSTIGTYYNNSNSEGDNGGSNHNLTAGLNNRTDKWFINSDINLGFGKMTNSNISANNQTGAMKQGFRNENENTSRTPNVGVSLMLNRKLKEGKKYISGNFHYNRSSSESLQSILSNTLYYDQTSGDLLKDSLLHRNITNDNKSESLNFSTGYNFSIGKSKKDSLLRRSISLNYRFNFSKSTNNLATSVLDTASRDFYYVDSLSSYMRNQVIAQTIGVNYNYSKQKTNFSAGINFNPLLQKNYYAQLDQEIENNSLNFSPVLNFSTQVKPGKTIAVSYNGRNSAPSQFQLQPIPNTRNLQNIIIGNPDLKPFFSHNFSSNYNFVKQETGKSLMVSANFSTIQDQVVENIIILPDTLGSFKRETRYINANGNYNLGGNYTFTLPMKDKKWRLTYDGSIGVSNRIQYIDNEGYSNEGLNYSQALSMNINLKTVILTTRLNYNQVNNNNIVGLSNMMGFGGGMDPVFNIGQMTAKNFFTTKSFGASWNGRLNLPKVKINSNVNYSFSRNENPSLQESIRKLHNLNMAVNGRVEFLKTYQAEFNTSKRINTGYALANQNPLLIGLGITKMFLKNKNLFLSARVSDLLNQGNMLNRQVMGNSIIDSRTNVITRVFSLNLRYDLSRFGGRGVHIRVDPDL